MLHSSTAYVLVKSRAQAEQGFMRLRTAARLGLFTFQPTSFCFSQMHFLPPKLDYKLIFLPCSLALRSTILHRNWWKWFRWVIPQNMLSPSTRTMKKCTDRTATFASSARFKHLLDDSFINRLIIYRPGKQSINEKSKIRIKWKRSEPSRNQLAEM